MSGNDQPARDPLLTLTHARLRAGQGDLRGARRVLRGMLECSPDHPQAKRLLEQLGGIPSGSASAARIRRLEAWLSRFSRQSSR